VTKEEYWEDDGHSASWATLQELYDYADKFGQTKQSGMVSPAQAEIIDAGGLPTTWCGSTSDESYVKREWVCDYSAIDYLIEKLNERAKDVLWVYSDGRLPRDKAEKFRIVFFFDN